MTPTLLEAILAIFVLWVAWQIAVLVAPRLLRSFLLFWRISKPPVNFGPQGSEKNITPPAAANEAPRQNYASPRK